MDDFGGFIDMRYLQKQIGLKGQVNPIAVKSTLRDDLVQLITTHELQQYVRRYVWKNLPAGLDPTLMERMMYYRGRIVLFKLYSRYYQLPFALKGTIDCVGRFNSVVPLTFNGSTNEEMFIKDFTVDVCNDPSFPEHCNGVIVNDRTQEQSEFIIPRYIMNLALHKELANVIVLIRHNLISSAKVYTFRVGSEAEQAEIEEELSGMENSILSEGKRIFVVTAPTAIQELMQNATLDVQNYWQCYVSLDNLRENFIGIENTGIFKKKERELQKNAEIEAGNADLIYRDGLFVRQQACERFNAVFGENIWCEESDVISGIKADSINEEEGDTPDGTNTDTSVADTSKPTK